jgi:hypothetical protein
MRRSKQWHASYIFLHICIHISIFRNIYIYIYKFIRLQGGEFVQMQILNKLFAFQSDNFFIYIYIFRNIEI